MWVVFGNTKKSPDESHVWKCLNSERSSSSFTQDMHSWSFLGISHLSFETCGNFYVGDSASYYETY